MPKQYLDKTGLERYNSAINTKLNNKVDKDGAKVLSSNDFTNDYKSNVDNNTNLRHSHDNKTILDSITNEKIEKWDSGSVNNAIISDNVKKIVVVTQYPVILEEDVLYLRMEE